VKQPIRQQPSRVFAARMFAALALIILAYAILAPPDLSFAQTPATALERLEIDFWPDYDQPSVLVIMSGVLPSDTPLPATVTLPLPGDASLNAVARVSSDNSLMADISYDESVPGQLTLTTPEQRFRVEYYFPYEADGSERNFAFDWRADVTVFQLIMSVQQPALASDMTLNPAAAGVSTRQDGLQYHDMPPQSVPEGQTFTLDGAYTLAQPGLTVDFLETQQPAQSAPSLPVAAGESSGTASFNWPVLLAAMGTVLAIGAIAWFALRGRRSKRRVAKPRPVRQPKAQPASGKAKYCHQCGHPASPGDRFCSNCGTALKDLA
jgi:hypothetical protein